MVFERYLMGSTDSDVESLPQRIYIQDVNHKGEVYWLSGNSLMCSHTSAAGYNLKEWYISPLASIRFRNDVEWTWVISFDGWSGFAILKFEHIDGSTVIAIVRQEAAISMTLHPPSDIYSSAREKSSCYAQYDFLRPVSDPTASILYPGQVGILLDGSTFKNSPHVHNFILWIFRSSGSGKTDNDDSEKLRQLRQPRKSSGHIIVHDSEDVMGAEMESLVLGALYQARWPHYAQLAASIGIRKA